MLIEGMFQSCTDLTKNTKIDICRTFPRCGSAGRGLRPGCHLEMPLWSRATFETCHALLDQVKQTEPRQCRHRGDSISPGLQVRWQREIFPEKYQQIISNLMLKIFHLFLYHSWWDLSDSGCGGFRIIIRRVLMDNPFNIPGVSLLPHKLSSLLCTL